VTLTEIVNQVNSEKPLDPAVALFEALSGAYPVVVATGDKNGVTRQILDKNEPYYYSPEDYDPRSDAGAEYGLGGQ